MNAAALRVAYSASSGFNSIIPFSNNSRAKSAIARLALATSFAGIEASSANSCSARSSRERRKYPVPEGAVRAAQSDDNLLRRNIGKKHRAGRFVQSQYILERKQQAADDLCFLRTVKVQAFKHAFHLRPVELVDDAGDARMRVLSARPRNLVQQLVAKHLFKKAKGRFHDELVAKQAPHQFVAQGLLKLAQYRLGSRPDRKRSARSAGFLPRPSASICAMLVLPQCKENVGRFFRTAELFRGRNGAGKVGFPRSSKSKGLASIRRESSGARLAQYWKVKKHCMSALILL